MRVNELIYRTERAKVELEELKTAPFYEKPEKAEQLIESVAEIINELVRREVARDGAKTEE